MNPDNRENQKPFLDEIASHLAQYYPLVVRSGQLNAYLLMSGAHCSFEPTTPWDTTQDILEAAFTRAGTNGYAQTIFDETGKHALHIALEAVRKGQIHWEHGWIDITVSKKAIPVTVPSVSLVGDVFIKNVLEIPKPLLAARQLTQDAQNLERVARGYATDETKGYGYAVIFLALSGKSTGEIADALANKGWLRSQAAYFKESRFFIFKPGDLDTNRYITTIWNLLTPTTLRSNDEPTLMERFNIAIGTLRKWGVDVVTQQNRRAFEPIPQTVISRPRINLATAIQIAQEINPIPSDTGMAHTLERDYQGRVTTLVTQASFDSYVENK